MNTINFSNSNKNFPLSTQALEFMKVIAQQAYQLTALGGAGNYILSGCINTSGNNWSSGWVVISGEMLPFTGGVGTLTGNVRIVETKEAVIAGYETYHDVYVRRTVEFGTNVGGTNTHVWNTFTRVKSNIELAAQSATKEELLELSYLMMPKGSIIDFDVINNVIPNGFHEADGSFIEGYGWLPDRRKRVSVGRDTRINQSQATNVTDLTENYGVAGSTGGRPNVLLTGKQSGIQKHRHGIAGTDGNDQSSTKGREMNPNPDSTEDYGNQTKYIDNADALEAHENRMPYYVACVIVKVV